MIALIDDEGGKQFLVFIKSYLLWIFFVIGSEWLVILQRYTEHYSEKTVLNLEGKKAIVATITEVANQATAAVVADYRGITVSAMNALRKSARKTGVSVGVYRNTLARRALQDTEFACLSDVLVGSVALFFAQSDPGAAARLLRDFEFADKLTVRGLALGGKLMGPDQLKAVASLPSREEVLTQLVAVMNAPVMKFVRTMNDIPGRAVRVINAVAENKKAA